MSESTAARRTALGALRALPTNLSAVTTPENVLKFMEKLNDAATLLPKEVVVFPSELCFGSDEKRRNAIDASNALTRRDLPRILARPEGMDPKVPWTGAESRAWWAKTVGLVSDVRKLLQRGASVEGGSKPGVLVLVANPPQIGKGEVPERGGDWHSWAMYFVPGRERVYLYDPTYMLSQKVAEYGCRLRPIPNSAVVMALFEALKKGGVISKKQLKEGKWELRYGGSGNTDKGLCRAMCGKWMEDVIRDVWNRADEVAGWEPGTSVRGVGAYEGEQGWVTLKW